jgi:hypothetical protein
MNRRMDQNQRQMMLAVYETVIADKHAIYCSGPITSGRLALEWFKNHPSQEHDIDALPPMLRSEFNTIVVVENTSRLKLLASNLRRRTAKLVIDPSALPENEWKQELWREFWRDVIDRFVELIVLAPDWEFSKGACWECLFGLRTGISVKFCDDSEVDLRRAKECIGRAVKEMKNSGFRTQFFEELLETTASKEIR